MVWPCSATGAGTASAAAIVAIARSVASSAAAATIPIAGAAVAERIAGLVGADAAMDYLDLPTDDPLQRCPDITRARHLLDWQPKVPLDEGLAETVDYFRGIV